MIDFKEILKRKKQEAEENIIKSVSINENLFKRIFIKYLEKIIPGYELDQINKPIINNLFHYFVGNKSQCKKNNISLKKGIFLVGGVGTGKTSLMRAFKIFNAELLKVNTFQFHYSADIIRNIDINGLDYFELFNLNMRDNRPNPITCLIDDIAAKNEKITHYGTRLNAIEDIINTRYNIYINFRKLTHFTTNIYPSELKSIYDERTIDRIKEMCNIIELTGQSRRK